MTYIFIYRCLRKEITKKIQIKNHINGNRKVEQIVMISSSQMELEKSDLMNGYQQNTNNT